MTFFPYVFILLFTLTSQSVYSADLPDLGASDLRDYDAQTETELGRAFSTALHVHYDLFYDPISLSYVRRIGEKITSETGQSRHFSFFIINDPNINAFAGPNGVIGINTGLITAAKSEDELASVVAHEIAHVTQRHLSRIFEYQSSVSAASIASILAAILIGTQDPSAGIATYMGAMGLSIQQQLKNSRLHESEADHFGIQYLYSAGYNPLAMSEFFGRLEKESQIYEFKPPEILRTHPVTANRLADAKDRAEQLGHENQPLKHTELELIQLRVAYLTQGGINAFNRSNLSDLERCYLDNLEALSSETDKNTWNLKCLESALKSDPTQRLLLIQKAQILNNTDPEQAKDVFQNLMAFYPSDFSLPYLYAVALEKNNKLDDAIELLKKETPRYHYQYLLYSKLAQLFAHKNQTKYVYYYDALANYNIGNLQKSIHLIKQSKRLEKNKKSQFYEKLNRIESELTPLIKVDTDS